MWRSGVWLGDPWRTSQGRRSVWRVIWKLLEVEAYGSKMWCLWAWRTGRDRGTVGMGESLVRIWAAWVALSLGVSGTKNGGN
jgi:hypothetical protein